MVASSWSWPYRLGHGWAERTKGESERVELVWWRVVIVVSFEAPTMVLVWTLETERLKKRHGLEGLGII